MTLVVGLRLSDRVCLAADVRVTIRAPDGTVRVRDDCLKIEHLSRHTAVGCAGNVRVVQAIIRALVGRITTTTDPSWVRRNLIEVASPVVEQFLAAGIDYKDARCCLLFAGLTDQHYTEISREDFVRSLRHFRDAATRNHDTAVRTLLHPNNSHNVDAIANGLSRDAPHFRPAIREALKRRTSEDAPLVLPSPGPMLFGLEVTPPSSPRVVDAPWGSLLTFGADNLRQQDHEELSSRIEFSIPRSRQPSRCCSRQRLPSPPSGSRLSVAVL